MNSNLTGVRDGYDRWAAVYDHDANPLQALEGPAVRLSAGPVKGSTYSTSAAARAGTRGGSSKPEPA